MAEKLQPVRGTHDLFGDEKRLHDHIVATARRIAGLYGYEPMATPAFEFSEVFRRTLGDESDIVTKEMYSFTSGKGREIVLRPEGTAPVARALVSNGRLQDLPARLFYEGPMFRRERPQKGRQRQFHQAGIELVGDADPFGDVEVIAAAHRLLVELGLGDDVRLRINTLGSAVARENYRAELLYYFRERAGDLSEDSRYRLERNPLRILDSKDAGDREVVKGAPSLVNALDEGSREFFGGVLEYLDILGIDRDVDSRLVRGLDYYCHTTFEFVADRLGAQNAVIAGGRYDGLTSFMGGAPVAGVGWAAGIERLALLMGKVPPKPKLFFIAPEDAATRVFALALAERMRDKGKVCEVGLAGGFKRELRRADQRGAQIAVLLSGTIVESGRIVVRHLDTGKQEEVSVKEFLNGLAEDDGD